MDYAEKLLIIEHEMHSEFGTPDRQLCTLRIGAIESVLHTWLIPMVNTLKISSPPISFELTIETTLNLGEQIRRGALDIAFSARPAQEEGLVSEPLEPLEMVFAGARTMAPDRLELDALLRHDILTFQRGSHPHVSLLNALQAAGIDDKHVHAISSISALTLLAGSGFGIATRPRWVAERLGPDTVGRILETALPLAPLPLHASYWNYPMNPVFKQAIRDAIVLARAYAADEAPLQPDEMARAARTARFSAPGTAGSGAFPAGLSAFPGAS
jgi:DNA-binding transcriptional LysR family regulator